MINLNDDVRFTRWQDKSPECLKNLTYTKWFFEAVHLTGSLQKIFLMSKH